MTKATKTGMITFIAIFVPGLITLGLYKYGFFSNTTTTTTGKAAYLCPMHPTYTSDRPGDCPICNMRLVPAKSFEQKPAGNTNKAQSGPATYACPLHTDYTATEPGDCPICGTALVQTKAAVATADDLATVMLSNKGIQLAGIQTVPAVTEKITHTIRTVGSVVPDETRIRHIHTKSAGWIEKLYINFTGQAVQAGEPLFTMYSQDLLVSQKQFVQARQAYLQSQKQPESPMAKDAAELMQSARKRLELLDVPETVIAQLEQSLTPQRTITFIAPVTGFVTAKSVFEGQQVEPGMELFVVTDLAQVWIEADFYEFEAHMVYMEQDATITSPYNPHLKLAGKVSYIYPYLNPTSRTLKVRFKFANPKFELKLGMYMDVSIALDSQESVVIPDSAIMDSGMRKIVFVDKGEFIFEPRQVKIGIRSNGKAQVLSGVQAGERVVHKGNFLLDSESRLRSAVK